MTHAGKLLASADAVLTEATTIVEESAGRRYGPRRQSVRGGGRRASDPAAEWLPASDYCAKHTINRKTLEKWMQAGLVSFYRVEVEGAKKPLIRVRNLPPTPRPEESYGTNSPQRSILDATG